MSLPVVIIVSPYFPPSNLAGVHRARHLAKHLPARGWRPIILCVDEHHHETPVDPLLERLVPDGVEVVKVSALPTRLCRPLGLGEIGLRAWFPMRRALLRLIEKYSAEAVLITGSPFYPMLLGSAVKRRYDIPVVLDFQDPWISTWGAAQPKYSKAGASHALATLLEPRAVRSADFLTGVSDRQNADMQLRYPAFPADRMAAIPIGGDPDDFRLAARMADEAAELLDPSFVNFTYVGTFWPAAEPVTRLLLRGLRRLREDQPRLANGLRLNFVGTSYGGSVTPDCTVLPIAVEEGVDDLVREIPYRVPFAHALRLMAASQALLLIGSDEPHYTASKAAPILMSGTPFLALLHRDSSAAPVLAHAGGGVTIAFADRAEMATLDGAVAQAIGRIAQAPDALGSPDPAAYAALTAGAVAARYAEIFDLLTAKRR